MLHIFMVRTSKCDVFNGYYGFLNAIVNYSPFLLCSEINRPYFTQYLGVLLHGITQINLIAVNKICVITYHKLASSLFARGSTVPADVSSLSICNSQILQIFIHHIMNEVTPVIFEFYHMPQFSMRDPQSITTVNEIGTLIHFMTKNCPEYQQ